MYEKTTAPSIAARVGHGLLLLAAMLLLVAPRHAAAGERLLGADKALHFGVSFALAASAYGGLTLLGDDGRMVRLAISVPAALLPGLAKEIYDGGQPKNRFSGADLLWDLWGVVAGAGTALLLDVLLTRRPTQWLRVVPLPGGALLQARWIPTPG